MLWWKRVDQRFKELETSYSELMRRTLILEDTCKEQSFQIDSCNQKIGNLSDAISVLSEKIDLLKNVEIRVNDKISIIKDEIRNDFGKILNDLNSDRDKKLIELDRRTYEKYYNIVESIFRFSEFVPVLKNEQDNLRKLKEEAQEAMLETKWAKERKAEADKIMAKGESIMLERNKLHDEMLIKERRGEPIDKIQEQLKAFDWIIREIKK